jgi:membrane fusion protein (multidrug efflux system)
MTEPLNPTESDSGRSSARLRSLAWLALVIALMAGAYAVYWHTQLRGRESTDNAYVQAPMVQITPQQSGTVVAVLVDDTDAVTAGQTLVKLDATDARLALERSEAQLGQSVREVRTLFANNGALSATVRLKQADVERLKAELAKARDDLARRRPLLASGAIGTEEFKHAESAVSSATSALAAAQSALEAARDQALSNQALTDGTTVSAHPGVQKAAAAVREAWLVLDRTEIKAPVAGQVAKRTVQLGQRLAPGAVLMSVVPLDRVWVDANFKEIQLRHMRIGQRAVLQADVYGGKIEFEGRVAGLGAGTGAAFAVLPAQNATGNWIKVVQRVPVRIELDAAQLARHPLRVGLSMEATVDVSDDSGTPLAEAPRPAHAQSTAIFAGVLPAAEQRVREIILANLGGSAAMRPGVR